MSQLIPFNSDQITLIKNTICKGATDDEFKLFLHVCQRTGLDPLMKQIYSVPRGRQRSIQTSIDGLRLIAERTERYSPGKEPLYEYDDKGNVVAATAYIKKMTKDGTWHEVSAKAFMKEYRVANNDFWLRMPHVMLAKCAESAALRKAFPAEMSGLYSDDEMVQADEIEIKPEVKYLTPEQINEIKSLLGEDDQLHNWFADQMQKKGINGFTEIEATKFQGIMAFINDKKSKGTT